MLRPQIFILTALVASTLGMAQGRPDASTKPAADPKYGVAFFESQVGSFKLLPGGEVPAQGKLEFFGNGTFLVSRLQSGGRVTTTGTIKLEYNDKKANKQVYFGRGSVVVEDEHAVQKQVVRVRSRIALVACLHVAGAADDDRETLGAGRGDREGLGQRARERRGSGQYRCDEFQKITPRKAIRSLSANGRRTSIRDPGGKRGPFHHQTGHEGRHRKADQKPDRG